MRSLGAVRNLPGAADVLEVGRLVLGVAGRVGVDERGRAAALVVVEDRLPAVVGNLALVVVVDGGAGREVGLVGVEPARDPAASDHGLVLLARRGAPVLEPVADVVAGRGAVLVVADIALPVAHRGGGRVDARAAAGVVVGVDRPGAEVGRVADRAVAAGVQVDPVLVQSEGGEAAADRQVVDLVTRVGIAGLGAVGRDEVVEHGVVARPLRGRREDPDRDQRAGDQSEPPPCRHAASLPLAGGAVNRPRRLPRARSR